MSDFADHFTWETTLLYTNATFIDRAMAKKLVELGNIAPQISVNGPGEYTDASRVKGAFEQAMQAQEDEWIPDESIEL